MSAAVSAVHVPAFKRRQEERKHAIMNPTTETMQAQLANCEAMLLAGRFGNYRREDIEARAKQLKTQLGYE